MTDRNSFTKLQNILIIKKRNQTICSSNNSTESVNAGALNPLDGVEGIAEKGAELYRIEEIFP